LVLPDRSDHGLPTELFEEGGLAGLFFAAGPLRTPQKIAVNNRTKAVGK